MKIGSLAIDIERRRVRTRRRGTARPLLMVGAVLVCATLTAFAVPAGADNAATGTVAVNSSAVRSISVSPTSFDYSNCWSSLGSQPVGNTVVFPHGFCLAPSQGITITNGSAPANIEVQATDFRPSDGLNYPWTLCTGSGPSFSTALGIPACTGSGSNPGLDQAEMGEVAGPYSTSSVWSTLGTQIGLTPTCDTSFNYPASPVCTALGGQSQEESPLFYAPSSSSDDSASFSNTVTWSAVPAT